MSMMLECLKKNSKAIELLKNRYDQKIEGVNKKVMQIEEALEKIMENNVAMMKVSTTNMNALVTRLEEIHNEKNVIDLEKDTGVSSLKAVPCSSRRTRQSAKMMVNSLPRDFLDLKDVAKTMLMLEKEASQALNVFKQF